EPVDVGHVHVADDEVVAAARQQAHRVESARGLDDLEIAPRKSRLERGTDERARRGRVLDQQNSGHDRAYYSTRAAGGLLDDPLAAGVSRFSPSSSDRGRAR